MFRTLIILATLSSPAFAQEREWMLDAAGEDAFLVFGVADTNDIGLSLWCKIGSSKVKLFVPDGSEELKPDQDAAFTVETAGQTFEIKGRTSDNAERHTTSVEAEVAADHPLFKAMTAGERLAVTVKNHKVAVPLDAADVKGLLRLCGQPSG